MSALRRQEGQVMTLAAVFMVSVLGMAALVIDAGAWFRAHRAAQAGADAAALAGAQELPYSTADASSMALSYANENGGGLSPSDISFSSGDTITVRVHRTAPTFFSRLFGISDFSVSARASARAGGAEAARWAAPIGVDEQHELLSGGGCPCFNQSTTLDLKKTGPGAFRLLNIDGSYGGTGQSTLAEWIRRGHDGFMPLGWYYSDPGAKFNASDVEAALDERVGTELLFPVYRRVQEQGAGFEYDVIGWVGFHLTGGSLKGSGGTLSGWFTRMIWEGIQTQSGPPSFGLTTIELIE